MLVDEAAEVDELEGDSADSRVGESSPTNLRWSAVDMRSIADPFDPPSRRADRV